MVWVYHIIYHIVYGTLCFFLISINQKLHLVYGLVRYLLLCRQATHFLSYASMIGSAPQTCARA